MSVHTHTVDTTRRLEVIYKPLNETLISSQRRLEEKLISKPMHLRLLVPCFFKLRSLRKIMPKSYQKVGICHRMS